MIKFDNVSFSYDKNKFLNNISLNFETGKFNTIIGPNGSGKSTLLKLILNENYKYSGKILLNNKDIKTIKNENLAKLISYVPQNFFVNNDFTVKDYVYFGRYPFAENRFNFSNKDEELVEKAIEQCELIHKKDKSLLSLSGGELQRVVIARVIAQDSDLILLDEPISNLDIHHQLSLLRLLKKLNKEYNKTIVIILHDLNMAYHFSDNIILMDNGEIIKNGICEDVIESNELKKVYRNEIEIICDESEKKNIVVKF